MTNVSSKIEEIIKKIMETNDNICQESELTTNVGMASIEIVELFVAIEKEIGIKIPDNMYGEPKTIKSLTEYIVKNKN